MSLCLGSDVSKHKGWEAVSPGRCTRLGLIIIFLVVVERELGKQKCSCWKDLLLKRLTKKKYTPVIDILWIPGWIIYFTFLRRWVTVFFKTHCLNYLSLVTHWTYIFDPFSILHEWHLTDTKLFLFRKIFILCIWVFCNMCHMRVIPTKATRGHQLLWNWSYWQLWAKYECWDLNPGP